MNKMKFYINVKFGVSNKTYYFATDEESLKVGDCVVVETIVGLEIGEVVTYPKDLSTLNFDREIKPILRKATNEDMVTFESNKTLALEACSLFEDQVKKLNLNMNLISAQYTLDRTKILFVYVADDRVDFRELLKVLASSLHCRIELKQINSRERAQLVGGLGTCGLPLCCTTFLTQFEGVSLNKAKNQMLAINIPKLSGQCGKLMCCLKYEDDLYTEAKKEFPPINFKFKYKDEEYKVSSYNVLTKVIKIQSPENVEFISLDEFKKISNGKSNFIKINDARKQSQSIKDNTNINKDNSNVQKKDNNNNTNSNNRNQNNKPNQSRPNNNQNQSSKGQQNNRKDSNPQNKPNKPQNNQNTNKQANNQNQNKQQNRNNQQKSQSNRPNQVSNKKPEQNKPIKETANQEPRGFVGQFENRDALIKNQNKQQNNPKNRADNTKKE